MQYRLFVRCIGESVNIRIESVTLQLICSGGVSDLSLNLLKRRGYLLVEDEK